MRRLQVQHDITGTCVKTPTLKSFPLLSIQGNANDTGKSSGCSAWAGITCAGQKNRWEQTPVVLIWGCLGCLLDQELVELTVSSVFWLNASKLFVFHLIFLHWLFPRRAVQLGPNSGAADAASGTGKSGCRNGQIQQLLGVAKWLWQPDLSVESQAGCCSCGVGGFSLMGHWLLLPQQPCAAMAGTKCAQTSQWQQKPQLRGSFISSCVSQCCPSFSHTQGPKAHTKSVQKLRIYSSAQCICLIKISNFNCPGLSPLLLVT